MSRVVIHGEGLGKRYHRGALQQSTLLKDHLSRTLKSPLSVFRRPKDETFWALKDVSLEVREGEILGIIGRNGAGKSTLLKILSRITRPTTGFAEIHGRVGSLLEVGTGFHPELTGRENIFLNGAILGMERAEIKRKFDEIVDFSGVEKFLDTPVKRYSSGMYVRLAFAVAAHLDPEILIVDEVLSVGDAEFQKKCLGKIQDVARGAGRTVLLVSHNMIAVQSLCQRVVRLERGRIKDVGPSASVIGSYLAEGVESNQSSTWDDPATAPGNDIMRIRRIAISDGNDPECTLLTMQTEILIEAEYTVEETDDLLHITYHLLNDQGIMVLSSWNKPRVHSAGRYRVVCKIPANLLNSGKYRLNLFIVQNENLLIYGKEPIASFDVKDIARRNIAYMERAPGIVHPVLEWRTEGPLPSVNPEEPRGPELQAACADEAPNHQ